MILEATVAGTALAGAAVHGAFHRNSPVFGPALGRLPTRERVVSLTFDDGPNPRATLPIIDALAARGVRATFFILGRHADKWPELVRAVRDGGHQLGNHGYHHRKLHRHGPSYVRRDLEMGTTSIERAAGVRPRVFRAPHGFRSPWVTPIAASLGQRTIGWSLGVWDTDRPGADVIAQRTIDGASPGAILLLHDGDGYDELGDREQTAHAVGPILDGLLLAGYRFVTLPEA